jgi:hypothetical protein
MCPRGDYVFLREVGVGVGPSCICVREWGFGSQCWGCTSRGGRSGIEGNGPPANVGLSGDVCGWKARFAVRTELESMCEAVRLDVRLENG